MLFTDMRESSQYLRRQFHEYQIVLEKQLTYLFTGIFCYSHTETEKKGNVGEELEDEKFYHYVYL